MTQKIYVPARPGQRIAMPGNQPDWPVDGQPINELDALHRRMVRDGDLVEKREIQPETQGGKGGSK